MKNYKNKSWCIGCGCRSNILRHSHNYCTIKCYSNHVQIRKNELHIPVPCKRCGSDFVREKLISVFCSDVCKYNVKDNSDFSLFRRDDFKCIYCGKSSIEDGVKLVIEHITPIILGGLTSIDNLITSCNYCNSGKCSSELKDDVKLRVIKILSERNKHISKELFLELKMDIDSMQVSHRNRESKAHNSRVNKLKNKR